MSVNKSNFALGACFGCIVALLLAPAGARASTYYLSGSGSDRGAGTLSHPWRTIERAERVVRAGDTVYLRAGTYGKQGEGRREQRRTVLRASGTARAPISWRRYPGDPRPVFFGALRITGAHNRVSGLLFDGRSGPIEEQGGTNDVLVWLNAAGARLDHSEVRNSAWHAGVFVSRAAGFSVDHDYIHDNGVTANLDHGVYVSSGSSGRVADNLIADNFAWGVQLYPDVRGVTVVGNTILGNGNGGVIVANESADNLIVRNVVVGNREYGIRGYRLTGTGNRAVDNLVWNQPVDITGSGMSFRRTVVVNPLLAGAAGLYRNHGHVGAGESGVATLGDAIDVVFAGFLIGLGAFSPP